MFIKEIFLSFYATVPTALLISFLFMFFYKKAKKEGCKNVIQKWIHDFRMDKKMRGAFFVGLYMALVLFRTILGREYRSETMEYILCGWGFRTSNKKEFCEAIENIVMLFPFTLLCFYYYGDTWIAKYRYQIGIILIKGLKISFIFSLCIEVTQFCFRLGSIQFSDLIYNTLGGIAGAFLGVLISKMSRKK